MPKTSPRRSRSICLRQTYRHGGRVLQVRDLQPIGHAVIIHEPIQFDVLVGGNVEYRRGSLEARCVERVEGVAVGDTVGLVLFFAPVDALRVFHLEPPLAVHPHFGKGVPVRFEHGSLRGNVFNARSLGNVFQAERKLPADPALGQRLVGGLLPVDDSLQKTDHRHGVGTGRDERFLRGRHGLVRRRGRRAGPGNQDDSNDRQTQAGVTDSNNHQPHESERHGDPPSVKRRVTKPITRLPAAVIVLPLRGCFQSQSALDRRSQVGFIDPGQYLGHRRAHAATTPQRHEVLLIPWRPTTARMLPTTFAKTFEFRRRAPRVLVTVAGGPPDSAKTYGNPARRTACRKTYGVPGWREMMAGAPTTGGLWGGLHDMAPRSQILEQEWERSERRLPEARLPESVRQLGCSVQVAVPPATD